MRPWRERAAERPAGPRTGACATARDPRETSKITYMCGVHCTSRRASAVTHTLGCPIVYRVHATCVTDFVGSVLSDVTG